MQWWGTFWLIRSITMLPNKLAALGLAKRLTGFFHKLIKPDNVVVDGVAANKVAVDVVAVDVDEIVWLEFVPDFLDFGSIYFILLYMFIVVYEN